ncbi:MAG: poly-gamma-glutamate system protein [Vicinamibacterales bacterium]|nr:poly-gamma-glutamate system protein [Vicinamibacterales bacterium]
MTAPLVRLPRWFLTGAGIGVIAALGLSVAGWLPVTLWPGPGHLAVSGPGDAGEKAMAAEARMRRAARAVHAARLAAGLATDAGGTDEDVAFVGSELTPFVTTLGSLEAKRVAALPGWARVLTRELSQAGVGPGSMVAANFSGSFPGLNVAVICAAHELGARLVAVSSVTASTWGATDPGFTWPEIEVRLVREGIVRPASAAVSVGGDGDRGLDLEPDARVAAERLARDAARALGATLLAPSSADEAVRQRVAVFDERAASRPIAVFVNVGGTEAAMGRSPAILRVPGGWVRELPEGVSGPDGGLIGQMSARGTPVLHLLNVRELARRWGVR